MQHTPQSSVKLACRTPLLLLLLLAHTRPTRDRNDPGAVCARRGSRCEPSPMHVCRHVPVAAALARAAWQATCHHVPALLSVLFHKAYEHIVLLRRWAAGRHPAVSEPAADAPPGCRWSGWHGTVNASSTSVTRATAAREACTWCRGRWRPDAPLQSRAGASATLWRPCLRLQLRSCCQWLPLLAVSTLLAPHSSLQAWARTFHHRLGGFDAGSPCAALTGPSTAALASRQQRQTKAACNGAWQSRTETLCLTARGRGLSLRRVVLEGCGSREALWRLNDACLWRWRPSGSVKHALRTPRWGSSAAGEHLSRRAAGEQQAAHRLACGCIQLQEGKRVPLISSHHITAAHTCRPQSQAVR
jgi:hypothetical protein